jgi:hypothetical protein
LEQYRIRAQELRKMADATTDEAARHALPRDAEMWDPMAAFAENRPVHKT